LANCDEFDLALDITPGPWFLQSEMIPTFFLIDKKGTVRYTYKGMPPKRHLIQKNVEELLAE
jgi:hypothetical protein